MKGDQERKPIPYPPIDVRRAEYQREVQNKLDRNLPPPDPISQYLVEELDVTGIFKDPKGIGAFLRVKKTGGGLQGSSFFVRRGARCYNGEVLRIEGSESGAPIPRVTFRELSRFEVKKKQVTDEKIVAKTTSMQQATGGRR